MVQLGRAPWTHKINFEFSIRETPNIAPDTLRDLVNSALPGPNYVHKSVLVDNYLNYDNWIKYSHIFSDEDPSLLPQLMYGFPTGVVSPESISVPFTNHATARKHPEIVQEYILKHRESGAVYGPYKCNPLDNQ